MRPLARPGVLGTALAGITLTGTLLLSCADPGSSVTPYQADPEIGATSFVSAGTEVADDRFNDSGGPLTPGAIGGEDSPGDRVVEEGDIFRPMGGGLVLNLNPWRGLQVLDLNDIDAPEVVGSLRLAGQPVEAYVVGDRALVLMNGWQAWFGAQDAAIFETARGGAVVVVDLSDPSLPVLVDHAYVGGDIRASRLTTGGGQTAIYVAAQDADWWYGVAGPATGGGVAVEGDAAPVSDQATLVRSFELVGGALQARGELDLGGWISDIHATTEALLVARTDWSESGSRVSVVDISDPGGALVEGADVQVAGQVSSQFNMDIRGDVLRVVSSSRGSGANTNHLETFDVSDPAAPVPVDHETFGDGEQLYATLFMADRAFFVTYFVQDPFHAFAIDPSGECTAKAEFVVSGWNDFFRSTLADTRLIGVGMDDAGPGRTAAVSLYDITDLEAANPLVARANVALESSWSGASWDHRAFTVLEDAVAVQATDGTPETGLVLLPFSGWASDSYLSGVQLFTFSATTLTARGVMSHDSPVARTFLADDATAANLSETTLALHDISAPDAPVAHGTLSLAPSYDALLVFGDHAVRLEATTDYWWYYEYQGDLPDWQAQVIALGGDPDLAAPLATIPVTPGASLAKVGDDLVVISARYDDAENADSPWLTRFAVWSLSNPAAPTQVGSFETRELRPYYSDWGAPDMFGGATDAVGYYWSAAPNAQVVGDALVFSELRYETEPAGTREVCITSAPGSERTGGGGTGVDPDRPPVPGASADDPAGEDRPKDPEPGDTYYVGEVVCVSENGGEPYCRGEIWQCAWFETGCEQVDPSTIETTTRCDDEPFTRTWQRWVLHVLDLTDPAAPALGAPVEMAREDQGVTTVTDGSTLYYSYRRPFVVAGDPRPFVKYFIRAIDLSTPAAPVVGDGVNVPGTLLAAQGSTLYTQDHVYDDTLVESAVSRLTLSGDKATLMARKRFGGREVQTMLIDDSGHALVTHRAPWESGVDGEPGTVTAPPVAGAAKADDATAEPTLTLSVLSSTSLTELSAVELHPWATLRAALASRAVFQVPGGLLVMNLETASNPYPQAWMPTSAWPRELVAYGDTLLFAGGRYGAYRLDLTTFQLFEPPPAASATR